MTSMMTRPTLCDRSRSYQRPRGSPAVALALLAGVLTLAGGGLCWAQDRLAPARALYETSFEEGEGLPAGWEVKYGTREDIEWSETHARTGKRSVRIKDESEESAVGLRGPKVPVTPGGRVWMRGWFFTEHKGGASIYIEYWDVEGKRMGDEVRSFGARAAGEWREVRGTDSVPEGATHVTLLLYSWSGGTCDGHFDDVSFGSGFQPTHDRTPRPLAKVKHPCGPYSREDIERARKNVERYQWAKDLLAGFKQSAQFWMDVPDEEIEEWIPELTPFRVVDCPNCGAHWAYCWSHLNEGRIKCRKCGAEYPNEKFPETETEVLLSPTGKLIPHPYYMDGKGKKHRLSGRSRYARITNLSTLGNMGRYYALTGDVAYAEKAVKVMRRLAEVYPDWVPHDWYNIYTDYRNTQSGKMSGWKLHDCNAMLEICLCYDLIYDSGALSEDAKVAIENSAFRELGEFLLPIPQCGCCINDGPFQMSAAAYLGVLLGDHRLIKWAVEPPGGFVGFIRDYFFRDGHWEDGSPSYEGMALNKLYLLPEILQGYSDPPEYQGADRYDNLDVLSDPLVRKIHIAPLYNMFPDRTLPPINDGAKDCGYATRHAEVNYFWYPTERNLAILNWVMRGRMNETGTEYSLFRREPGENEGRGKDAAPTEADETGGPTGLSGLHEGLGQLCLSENSVIRPGLGWAILREGEGMDRTDLVLDYGEPCAWHGHPDRLNYILWANGREVVTDLGYLGARHPFRPWMAHGVCHNLVMVDGTDQVRKPGKLILFQPGQFVQAAVAEAPETYPQCSRYERSLLLITPAPGVQYVADVFRVAGGEQHDFSFHGDGATFECENLKDARPYEGEVGPKAGGYDWLKDVQVAPAQGEIIADWRFGAQDARAADVGVRLRILDASGELINARGPNLRSQKTPYEKPMLDYVIQRRPGPRNTFMAIAEPVNREPVLRRAERLKVKETRGTAGDGGEAEAAFDTVAMRVEHPAGTDYVIIAPDSNRRVEVSADDRHIVLEGRLGVVSVDEAGEVRFLWLCDGSELRCDEMKLETAPSYSGTIVDFDEKSATFRVDAQLPEGTALAGQALIAQKRCDGAYTVDRVVRAGERSIVHLRDEPIMKPEPGETFSLATHALLSRRALASAGLGVLCSIVSAACGQATVPETKQFVYIRGDTGNWKLIEPVRNEGTVTLRLDPEQLGGGRARVLFTDREIDIEDVRPPELHIGPQPRGEQGSRFDLGFLRGDTIHLRAADSSYLGPIEYSLVGERAGPIPLEYKYRKMGRLPGLGSYTFPLPDLPEDHYTLRIALCDELGNEAKATISFQTVGIVRSFTEMKIVEDSGKLSKPLGSLDTQFYRAEQTGDFVVYEFEVEESDEYEATLLFTQAPSYGIWRVSVDGKPLGEPVDGYSTSVVAGGGKAKLGTLKLDKGAHRVRVETVGKNEASEGWYVGVRSLVLKPQ